MNIPDEAISVAAIAKGQGRPIRIILEAAAPFIAAQALRDEADKWFPAGKDASEVEWDDLPAHETAEALRARANELHPKETA